MYLFRGTYFVSVKCFRRNKERQIERKQANNIGKKNIKQQSMKEENKKKTPKYLNGHGVECTIPIVQNCIYLYFIDIFSFIFVSSYCMLYWNYWNEYEIAKSNLYSQMKNETFSAASNKSKPAPAAATTILYVAYRWFISFLKFQSQITYQNEFSLHWICLW